MYVIYIFEPCKKSIEQCVRANAPYGCHVCVLREANQILDESSHHDSVFDIQSASRNGLAQLYITSCYIAEFI